MKAVRYSVDDLAEDELGVLDSRSFFGSTSFASLWSSVGGFPVMYLVEEAGELVAALPAVEFGRSFYRRVQVMPDGCYARLRLRKDSVIDRAEVMRCLVEALTRGPHCRLIINDFSGLFEKMGRFRRTVCRTTLVDISLPGWIPPDKSIQRAIRKSEREGIEVVEFDAERHFKKFMSLMRQADRQHRQKSRYPEKFYRTLAQIASFDARLRWLWCEHDGMAAASTIVLVDEDSLLYWQGFINRDYSFLKPGQHILYSQAKAAAAQGIKYLNLGGSPYDAEGLKKYKARWGGAEYKYNSWQLDSGIGKLL